MSAWINTAHKGLRYYEHQTRRYGKRKDRYYSIRFMVDGQSYSYGVGWVSDGIPEAIRKAEPGLGFEEYCLRLLRQYKANVKDGTGPKSPKERRAIARAQEEAEREARTRAEAENVTFGDYFVNTYYPTFRVGRKKGTTQKAQEHFKNWLGPVLGHIPLKDITPFLLEKAKKNLLDAGRSPRTLQYVMATCRQVWNMARRDGLVSGDSPTRAVRLPRVDNRRVRFLSYAEAEMLLSALQEQNTTAYRMAVLALHTGLRVGEMAGLKWGHIDTERGAIQVMDAKGGKGRVAFMTETVKAMFAEMQRGRPEDFVFVQHNGKPFSEMPRAFFDVVDNLKLNEGITDARQKVVAHTLRHTFASWHVMAGTDIYTLKELLGHSVIQMTERYTHLAPATLQNATRNIERAINSAEQEKVVVFFQK